MLFPHPLEYWRTDVMSSGVPQPATCALPALHIEAGLRDVKMQALDDGNLENRDSHGE